MNVLLTCAGRRNYLVTYFQKALKGRGKVIAADLCPEAPALQSADLSLLLPPVSDTQYVSILIQLCKKHRIGLVVPLNDLELPILAAKREEFLSEGIYPLVARPEVIDICFDKWKTHLFLQNHGCPTVSTYRSLAETEKALSSGEISFPLVVKPRWGTASIAVETVSDKEELVWAFSLISRRLPKTIISGISATEPEKAVIIQSKIIGHEYGLDVINDLNGTYKTTLARRKISMRAGETDRAMSVQDEELTRIGCLLGSSLRHVGNLDCDVFMTPNGPRVLELNPRFGGGYPFSQTAGADLPSAIIAWLSGCEAEPEWLMLKPGLAMSKYDLVMSQVQEPKIG